MSYPYMNNRRGTYNPGPSFGAGHYEAPKAKPGMCAECDGHADTGQQIANKHIATGDIICDLCHEDAIDGRGRYGGCEGDFVCVRVPAAPHYAD